MPKHIMTISKRTLTNHFHTFDTRAIAANNISPTDRTTLDSAILGLVGPRSTFDHAINYLKSLNL